MSINKQSNIQTIYGEAYWPKILGKPVPNFSRDGFEWTMDVVIDNETVKKLKGLGLGPKIKNLDIGQSSAGHYITFKRAAVKKAGPRAGEDNQPIRVVGPDGKTEWDRNVLLGNKTKVGVKFSVNEVTGGPAKKTFIRPDILSVQVRELVPYERKEQPDFAPVDGQEANDLPKDW